MMEIYWECEAILGQGDDWSSLEEVVVVFEVSVGRN